MKCPNWLYRWVARRGYIPRWMRRIWKRAHWCPEMDELLIIDNLEDCFCGYAGQLMSVCIWCGRRDQRRMMTTHKECMDCVTLGDPDEDGLDA